MSTPRHATLKLLAASALCLAALGNTARADIITGLQGDPAVVAGGFAYTYSVQLTGQQQLDPAGNSQLEFGTVYDFGPIIGSITETGILATSFAFAMSLTNTAANQTAPTDSPILQNIRFTYTGSQAYYVNNQFGLAANAIQISDSASNLGTFTVVSPTNDLNHNVQYDGQARKATNDTVTGNVGYTSGPDGIVALAEVPEPASLALLGMGLVSAGLIRRRRPG